MVMSFEKTYIVLFALCPTYHSYQSVFIFIRLHGSNYKIYYKDIIKILKHTIVRKINNPDCTVALTYLI